MPTEYFCLSPPNHYKVFSNLIWISWTGIQKAYFFPFDIKSHYMSHIIFEALHFKMGLPCGLEAAFWETEVQRSPWLFTSCWMVCWIQTSLYFLTLRKDTDLDHGEKTWLAGWIKTEKCWVLLQECRIEALSDLRSSQLSSLLKWHYAI